MVCFDCGGMDGIETVIFKFYACLYTRPRRTLFSLVAKRGRGCGTMKTREEKPHLYSLQVNS